MPTIQRDPVKAATAGAAYVPLGRNDLLREQSVLGGAQAALRQAGASGDPLVPWYTPVIGSGPLGLPLELFRAARHLPEAMSERLDAEEDAFIVLELQGVEADPLLWLRDFVRQLVDDRAGSEITMVAPEYHLPVAELVSKVSRQALVVTVVAAQLTRMFHRISLDLSRPIGPWGSEYAALAKDHPRWTVTMDEYATVLGSCVEWARQVLEPDLQTDRYRGLDKLLRQIDAKASQGQVSLHHMQQITEVAWWLIVESVSTSPYPGWTELLLRLLLLDETGVAQGHRRPRLRDLVAVATGISKVLDPSTTASWSGLRLDSGREDRQFYDSVASALWAQYDFAKRNDPPGSLGPKAITSPYPTAFITSFDLELEMALWRTAPAAGAEFSIVVPTYYVEGPDDEEGDFLWVAGTVQIPPDGRRDDASVQDWRQALKVRSWVVLSSNLADLPKHPMVVRLSGCPMIQLPSLEASSAVLADIRHLRLPIPENRVPALIHSVTADEYLAVRQTEAEWLWTREMMNERQGSRGLPKALTHTRGNEPSRYWLLMGVPIKDPAIRMRVLAVLARDDNEEAGSASRVIEADESLNPEVPLPQPAPVLKAKKLGSRWYPAETAPSRDEANGLSASLDRIRAGGPTASAAQAPRRHVHRVGLAVNTRCDDDETMLLTSLGFTVVRDRCERFSEDLQSYATWLANQSLPPAGQRGH